MNAYRGSVWAGLGLAALALASCATRVTLPPLPECHPANAAAPSAERARPSGLLDRSASAPVAEPEATEDVHEGHEMQEAEEAEGHEHHEGHPPPPPPPPPGGAAP